MRLVVSTLAAVLAACAAPPRNLSNASVTLQRPGTVANVNVVREVDPTARVLAVLAQPGRSAGDRALDRPRQSADLLTFLGVAPGMRVAVLGAGNGYFTELVARAVGPRGVVFAQNDPALLAPEVGAAWSARLDGPAMRNVTRVDRGFPTPLPPEARDLDRVYLGADYSALVALGVDRASMNRVALRALARGGRYVVLDRTLPPRPDAARAHRDESRSVRREVESAGFALLTEGKWFRTSPDPSEWNGVSEPGSPAAGEDVFALVFVKP